MRHPSRRVRLIGVSNNTPVTGPPIQSLGRTEHRESALLPSGIERRVTNSLPPLQMSDDLVN